MTQQKDKEFREFWLKHATDGSGLWYETPPEKRCDNSFQIHAVEIEAYNQLKKKCEELENTIKHYENPSDGKCMNIAALKIENQKLKEANAEMLESMENALGELFIKCQPDKGKIFSAVDNILLPIIQKHKESE